VPADGLTFSQDGTTTTLQMTNVPIIDQPRWPAMDAETTPAFMDFKLVFKATTEPVKYEDPLRQFRSRASRRMRNWKPRFESHRLISHSRPIRSTSQRATLP
jgi:hypothetical protein